MIELSLLFICSCLLTLSYIVKWTETLLYGIFAFVCWFSVAWLWLFIEPISYMVSMLFFGIGIIILVTVLIGLLDNLREERMRGRQLAD